ncbi:MAG: hypothetical protein GXP61_03725 [Epsilonproteobacteria bacterium]|nr:hypothetical protein [Campylobacterota bacterium]
MALLKCEECGKKVSTKATSCPRCGGPAPKSKKGKTITPEQSAKMTYKERRNFQKSGGKILLSKWQKISFVMITIFILFAINKCNSGKDALKINQVQLNNALKQLNNTMKDPRKIRLMECEGIKVWETKPVGYTKPTASECAQLNKILGAEAIKK